MPIYEYQARDEKLACAFCATGFEQIQRLADEPLRVCPKCSAPIRKLISVSNVGASGSQFDDRAQKAGFHKLKRLGKGEYEKKY